MTSSTVAEFLDEYEQLLSKTINFLKSKVIKFLQKKLLLEDNDDKDY